MIYSVVGSSPVAMSDGNSKITEKWTTYQFILVQNFRYMYDRYMYMCVIQGYYTVHVASLSVEDSKLTDILWVRGSIAHM